MTNQTFQTGELGFVGFGLFPCITTVTEATTKKGNRLFLFFISQPKQQKLAEETKTAESNETSAASTSLCHEKHNTFCPYTLLWNK